MPPHERILARYLEMLERHPELMRSVLNARGIDVPVREVLHTSNLPGGTYTFYFGIDLDMNGAYDPGQAYGDSVRVTVTP
jgi:hypothetical protein